MKYDCEMIDNVNVVHIREKRLTSHEAPEMKTTILGLIVSDDNNVLIDMSHVDFMDSTGLGSFLFGIRQAEQNDKDLRFCSLKPRIFQLVQIAQLQNIIDPYGSVQEALDDFKRDAEDAAEDD